MEAGAGKVACRGARVNIGDIDEMVSTKCFFLDVLWCTRSYDLLSFVLSLSEAVGQSQSKILRLVKLLVATFNN